MLRFSVYQNMKLAGKINFEYLYKIFVESPGGEPVSLNLKSVIKAKKGMPPIDLEQLILKKMVTSKFRQNDLFTKKNIKRVALEYEEFLVFIC